MQGSHQFEKIQRRNHRKTDRRFVERIDRQCQCCGAYKVRHEINGRGLCPACEKGAASVMREFQAELETVTSL